MKNHGQSAQYPASLLKAMDVARRLNISRALAYELMECGEIPVVRFRRSVRVQVDDLEDYIRKHWYSSKSRDG